MKIVKLANGDMLSLKSIEKNILTARLITNNQVMENLNETVRFNAHSKIGNKLSFSNYKIKIGAGVSQILVSAVVGMQWDSPISNNGILTIEKNNTEIIKVDGGKPTNNASISTVAPSYLVTVLEGDTISIKFTASVGTIIHSGRTYVTVEVVK